EFLPRDLDRMAAIRGYTFDRGDFFSDGVRRGKAARPDRLTINMNRARAALPDTAAELRAGKSDVIADHPQQGRCRVGVNGMLSSIHVEIERHAWPPFGS